MKRFFKLLFLLMLFTLMSYTNTDNNCKIAHHGTFVYGSGSTFVKVIITDKDHTEYHNNGKYYIKSKIKWINDCEFVVTFIDFTVPDFKYTRDDQMHVKVNQIINKEIFFTSTINKKSWNGKLIKIK